MRPRSLLNLNRAVSEGGLSPSAGSRWNIGLAVLLTLSAVTIKADDDAVSMSPLALAFSAARLEEALTSDYRFGLDYRSQTVTIRAEVDPAAPEGLRLEVVTAQLAESEDAQRLEAVKADLERGAAEGYWCSALLKSVPEDARLVTQSDDQATYAFDPLPSGDRNDGFLENLTGEISVSRLTGTVHSFRLTAPKSFRQALVAKISEFELSTQCSASPDGRNFASDFQMSIKGSAAFRQFADEVVRRLEILESPAP